jgi:uncharacterized protein with GYD domain
MVKGIILVEHTAQGRLTIKDSPDRLEAVKTEASKLGIHVRDVFYIAPTRGLRDYIYQKTALHDAEMIVEAEDIGPIEEFVSSINRSSGFMNMEFAKTWSIEEMRPFVEQPVPPEKPEEPDPMLGH